MPKESNNTLNIVIGAVIGAMVMLLLINLISNNWFTGPVSSHTCAAMHGGVAFNNYIGFWFLLAAIIVAGAIAVFLVFRNGDGKIGKNKH